MKKVLCSFLGGTLVGLAALVSLPQLASADDVTDLYFQEVVERYFDYPQTARTFGMAGSSVMTTSNSSSVMGNPAGLGFMKGGEVSGTYSHNRISGEEFPTGREDTEQWENSGAGMLAVPLGPTLDGLPEFGNLGAAWYGTRAKWHDDSYDTIAEREQIAVAYSYALSETLSLGYSFGWIEDKFQARDVFNYPMGDGFRHTAGVMWKSSPNLTIGSTLLFGQGEHHALFGPGIKEESDTEQFGVDIGAQYQLERTLLAVSVNYQHLGSDGDVESSIPQNIVGGDENGNLFNVRFGVEHPFNDWFVGRAGYRYAGLQSYKYNRVELNDLNGSANYNAWTLGAGFIIPTHSHYIKSVNIDYGVEYRAVGDNDWQHLITVSVPFNLCAPS